MPRPEGTYTQHLFAKAQDNLDADPLPESIARVVGNWGVLLSQRGVPLPTELNRFLEFEAGNRLRLLAEMRFWRAYTLVLLEKHDKDQS